MAIVTLPLSVWAASVAVFAATLALNQDVATGRLEGRVVNGARAGAPDTTVTLCGLTEIPPADRKSGGARWTGCATEATATTDSSGQYRLDGVAPGSYVILVRTSRGMLYQTSAPTGAPSNVRLGGASTVGMIRLVVSANRTTRAADLMVLGEIELVAPANAALISSAQPTFSWSAVPGAARYDVTVAATHIGNREAALKRGSALVGGQQRVIDKRQTRDTRMVPKAPLADCDYVWWVEAYDAAGVKISESWNYWTNPNPQSLSGVFVVRAGGKPCR